MKGFKENQNKRSGSKKDGDKYYSKGRNFYE